MTAVPLRSRRAAQPRSSDALVRDGRLRERDLDPGRVRRVVGVYLAAAVVWILVSGALVDDVAARLGVTPGQLEVTKGLLFVVVTAGVLHQSLRHWAVRLQSAARTEQEAAARMRHADDMRATFLTGISHELRTPLTAIVGYSETLERRAPALSRVQLTHIAQRLVVNSNRLETLVLDLIEVDRLLQGLGHLQPAAVEITALARRVAADHGELATVVGSPVEAAVDIAKLERLLEHLLDNARRHTPVGTRVTVEVVTVEVAGDDHRLRIVVTDDGPGLPPEILGDLFEPFVQDPVAAARPSPGLGIGLTLVAQYARLHGGTASAENRVAGGARFTVELPRTPRPAPGSP